MKLRAVVGMAIGVVAAIVSGCASTDARQARTPNPPEWIYGTWSDCNPSRRAALGPDWKFSAHSIQRYSFGGLLIDLAVIREDQGADWYRFEYPNRGVPGGRNRFERDDDERLRWSVIFSRTWKETRTLCRKPDPDPREAAPQTTRVVSVPARKHGQEFRGG